MNLLHLTAQIERDKARFHSEANLHANILLVPVDIKLDLDDRDNFNGLLAGLFVIESSDVTTTFLAYVDENTYRALAHVDKKSQ